MCGNVLDHLLHSIAPGQPCLPISMYTAWVGLSLCAVAFVYRRYRRKS